MKKTTVLFLLFFCFVRIPANAAKPQVGAYFFYWYDCPGPSCNTDRMPVMPLDFNNYSAKNVNWYKTEFKAMEDSGLSMVIPVSWGNSHPNRIFFHDDIALPLMVRALDENNGKLKVAYFDDTNSVVGDWNQNHNKGYTIPTENGDPSYRMSLNDQSSWDYFYSRKMKNFFNLMPRKYWATHNGKSLEDGGRPIVIIYDAYRSFSDLDQAPAMWKAIKAAFKADFGVEPFLILDFTWFDYGGVADEMIKVADAKYSWGGSNDDTIRRNTINKYTTVDIIPGNKSPPDEWYRNHKDMKRNTAYLSDTVGAENLRLTSMWENLVDVKTNLVLIETWNELGEGTAIAKAINYPKNGGGFLSPDYYLKTLKQLISSKPANTDINSDNKTDLVDFSIWKRESTGKLKTKTSDFNNDNLVNIDDFNIWKLHYLLD